MPKKTLEKIKQELYAELCLIKLTGYNEAEEESLRRKIENIDSRLFKKIT